MLKKLLPILICLPLLLHARKTLRGTPDQQTEGPWFTGPLLSGSGHVVPVGHADYEPYLFWAKLPGSYNKHWNFVRTPPTFRSLISLTALQFGILPATEFDITTQFVYNNHGGQHMWRVSDLPIALGFQLLMDGPDTWWPAIKLKVGTVIPIGKYQRLNPHKLFTDAGGTGDWAPDIGLITIKTYHLGGFHYLAWRMTFDFFPTAPIPVHGLSTWGGAPSSPGIKGTRGTVYPGFFFTALQGFEYSLTHNWVLALDIQYQHVNRNRFSGRSPKGTKPVAPSSEQFDLAPAIEYNFNAHVGIITGPWFSIAGRNNNETSAFFTWVFAINIYQ